MSANGSAPAYGFNSLGLALALTGVLGSAIAKPLPRPAPPSALQLRRDANFARTARAGIRYARSKRMYLCKPF